MDVEETIKVNNIQVFLTGSHNLIKYCSIYTHAPNDILNNMSIHYLYTLHTYSHTQIHRYTLLYICQLQIKIKCIAGFEETHRDSNQPFV